MTTKFRHIFAALLMLLLTSAVYLNAQDATPEGETVEEETSSETEPIELMIWLPNSLVTPLSGEAGDVLERQTQAFASSIDNVEIIIRRKNENDIGGIFQTMLSASKVAPDILPDLTLVRRRDLLQSFREGLITSFDGDLAAATMSELADVLKLGEIDGELYAIPYILDFPLMMYQTDGEAYTDWTFDAVLQREQPFLLPLGNSANLINIFYLQYLTARDPIIADSDLPIDEGAIRQVLAFYEDAVQHNLLDEQILSYTSSDDYLPLFLDGESNSGIFQSRTYMQLFNDDDAPQAGFIPTANGSATTFMDSWMWVMTATDPDRQQLIIEYLNWMFDPEHQLEYVQHANKFPSQQAIIAQIIQDPQDQELIMQMVGSSIVPMTEIDIGQMLPAMRVALAAVLRGEMTADEATQSIISQFNPED